MPKRGYLISCPLSGSGAGPSSQPLGASADSVLPRHPASQPGRRGEESWGQASFPRASQFGPRAPEGIALLDQLLWVPLDRLCGILGEAQDSMAMVGTRCLPRGPVSRTDYVPAPTPPYTPARPLTCFLTLNIIIPFLYINFKESLIAMESSITHELVVSESRHNQFGASFPSDQRPSAVGKPVVYVYSWLFSVDSVFEMVSLYS